MTIFFYNSVILYVKHKFLNVECVLDVINPKQGTDANGPEIC